MGGGNEESAGRRRQTISELMAARKEGWPQQMQRPNTQEKDKQDPTKALKQRFLTLFGSLTPCLLYTSDAADDWLVV